MLFQNMEGSSFFRLSKGDNYLQLKAANNSQNGITCEMQFTPLVAGVTMDFMPLPFVEVFRRRKSGFDYESTAVLDI